MKLKKIKSLIASTLAIALMTSSLITANVFATSVDTSTQGYENANTSLTMDLVGRYVSGDVNFDGGVMEIITYNTSNGYAYAINGTSGNIAVIDMKILTGTAFTNLSGTEFDVKSAVEASDNTFAYGDMTSIAVSPDETTLAVALQADGYNDNGRVATFSFNADGSLSLDKIFTVGVQPDMLTFADDNTILTANEGEPNGDEGYAVADPKGSVSVIELENGTVTTVGFEKFDDATKRAELVSEGVMFKAGANASEDFEPEYISVADGKAYVALQEANAIAVLDIETKDFDDVYSLGYIDYGTVAFDLNSSDEVYAPQLHEGVYGTRMPDAIDSYVVNGKTYLVTANEGDGREYGDKKEAGFYCNEVKVDFEDSENENSPNGNMKFDDPKYLSYEDKITFIDPTTVDVAGNDTKDFMYGGRSFTIFEVTETGLSVAFDSAEDFEELTASYIPEYFNASNDNNFVEDRAGKKSIEPESVTLGEVNGRTYAFIALERIGGIMAYDVTDPSNATYVNYINTRDFENIVGDPVLKYENKDDAVDLDGVYEYDKGELDKFITEGDVAPEGLAFISAEDSPNGYPMLLTSNEVSGTVAAFKLGDTKINTDEVVILHTNDTHCDIENGFGFAGVASYKEEMEAIYGDEFVTLVDAGDAVQGGPIGKLTNGEAIIELMNAVGYDIFVPGNHEYDYQVPQFLKLMGDLNASVVSSNFMDLTTNTSVFDAYEIVDYGNFQVAYVGITTPETFTKSTPTYFQDADGNFIYSFSEGNNGENLYQNVQASVDAAKAEGADYIIALSHLGVDDESSPYKSTDVIANTSGFDVFIDGHSHTVIDGETVKDKDGNEVILTQTGEKFDNLGKITINGTTGEINAQLIPSDTYTTKDTEVQALVDSTNAQFEVLLNTVIAKTEVPLVVNNPTTGERMIRNQETNLGDLVADGYRTMLEADVAIVNGGGIRADIEAGDITYGDVIAVHPFGNNATSVRVSGQVLLDALEMGAGSAPEESGGFLQVSGMTYAINTGIESSVVTDEQGAFIKVDGEYRVHDVMIGDEELDLDKMYVVASHDYMLLSFGDGMTMFKGAEVVKSMFMIDNEVLMNYIQQNLDGVVGEEYANINGLGRITFTDSTDEESLDVPETGDTNVQVIIITFALMAIAGLLVSYKYKKN